jgi:group I intron endonuclease
MIIYKIINNINGKVYVGQTKNDLNYRISVHLKRNSLIGNALRKYGIQSFDISVIDDAPDRQILSDNDMRSITEVAKCQLDYSILN